MTRTVLGGVGAGAALALATPLAAPLLTEQVGPVEQTVPLRPVGAAALGTPAPSGPSAVPPAPATAASVARAAFASAPPDPGAPAASALRAAGTHLAERAREPDPGSGQAAQATGRPEPGRTAPDRTGPGRAVRAGSAGLTGALREVVELTNAERARAGCGALTVDPRISAAAQGHSEDMAAQDYFAHDSRDGRDFADRITAAGYSAPGAENIAMGQPDAATVVGDWMDSPGHRKNILDCSLTTIGVGLADGYWTQDFGR